MPSIVSRWVRSAALGWRMARPGFLVITVVACLVGMASAAACGCGFAPGRAAATLGLALLAHAAANMLNDHADAVSGADAANVEGVLPFTGGSRLVQQGVVQAQDMRHLAIALLMLVVPGGLWLAVQSGAGLVLLGLMGVLLGWAYSAPPLALMSRGVGELAVAVAWGLMVVGADYVQRGQFFLIPSVAAVSYALLIANILIANGLPDARSDAQVGKRTLAVRWGARAVAWVYLALAVLAHLWIAVMVWVVILPEQALWALASAPLALAGGAQLLRHGDQPARLRPALVLGIAAAVVHGLGLALGFWLVRV